MSLESRAVRKWRELYIECRGNIFSLWKNLHLPSPTDQQEHVLKLVQMESTIPIPKRKKRIAIKAGQGTGKTAVSNVIALYRIFRYDDSMCVVTAPTMRQAKKVWLAECRRTLRNSHPLLKKFVQITKSDVRIGGPDHPEWGIQLATGTKAENVQGFHEKHLTFIIDEASGVARPIVETIYATLSNDDSLLIEIGNPNTRDCSFFDCFTRFAKEWHLYTMNAETSPITDKDNIRKIEEEFGRDSDVYRVRVLGEFPYMDPNCVMSSEDLWACVDTDPYKCMLNAHGENRFGIDLARFGDAESVIFQRSGNTVVEHRVFTKKDPNDVIDYACELQRKSNWSNNECIYIVDAGGMGQGVMRNLYRQGKKVLEFHTEGTAFDKQYGNKMTEAMFHIAKLAKARNLHILNDYRLIQQLSTRLYFINKKGKLVLETKKEFCDRGYESPDRADALALCFYPHAHVQAKLATMGHSSKRVGMKFNEM